MVSTFSREMLDMEEGGVHPKPGVLAPSAVWTVIVSFHPEGQLRRRERVKTEEGCFSFLLLLVLTGLECGIC